MPEVAVRSPSFDPRLGRETVDLPNNKCNIYIASSGQEAFYLAAALNSEAAQRGLERFAAPTGITPVALQRLPIEQFDAAKPLHSRLAALGKTMTDLATDALMESPEALDARTEIDDVFRAIAAEALEHPT